MYCPRQACATALLGQPASLNNIADAHMRAQGVNTHMHMNAARPAPCVIMAYLQTVMIPATSLLTSRTCKYCLGMPLNQRLGILRKRDAWACA
eukprot:4441668-Pyramimonas_sp.AAC.2